MIGRFTTVDPLVEVGQESGTPYGYVGNNPINRIDPDGRIWEDKDGKGKNQNEADNIRNGINKTNTNLSNKNAKLATRAAKAEAGGNLNKAARLNNRITDNNQRIAVNNETVGALNSMQNDQSKTFRFGSDASTTEKEVNGQTVTVQVTTFARDANGTYVINNSGSLANKAHEITHGGQIVRGLVDVAAGSTSATPAAGVTFGTLEHQAYRANYGINGDKSLGFGSTVSDICGLDDPNFNHVVDQGKSNKP
jgi:hypothetical protein